jgi:hypothetical protein
MTVCFFMNFGKQPPPAADIAAGFIPDIKARVPPFPHCLVLFLFSFCGEKGLIGGFWGAGAERVGQWRGLCIWVIG